MSLKMEAKNTSQPRRLFRSHGSLLISPGLGTPPGPPTADLLDVCPTPNSLSPQSLSPSSPDRLSMLRSESPTEGFGQFKQV